RADGEDQPVERRRVACGGAVELEAAPYLDVAHVRDEEIAPGEEHHRGGAEDRQRGHPPGARRRDGRAGHRYFAAGCSLTARAWTSETFRCATWSTTSAWIS